MSTIQQLIEGYAKIYREPNVHGDLLSEKDFLANIARDIAIDNCNSEMSCAFRELERYRANPDQFTNEYLGAPGSTLRYLNEQKAKGMLRVAQKYRLSQEENKPDHPFHQEMTVSEEKYARCSLTRGIVEFLSNAPIAPSEQDAVTRKIEFCLSHGEKSLNGRLPSDNIVRP